MTGRPAQRRAPSVSDLMEEVDALLSADRFGVAQRTLEEWLPEALLSEVLRAHTRVTPAYGVHYTTVTAAANILETGGFRMYNTESSKDPLEGAVLDRDAVFGYLRRRHPWLPSPMQESASPRARAAYAFCAFPADARSEGGKPEDDLVRWRLYGDDGRGCSIKFNLRQEVLPMFRMNYTKSDDYGADRLPKALAGMEPLSEAIADTGRHFEPLPSDRRSDFRGTVKDAVELLLNWYRHLVKDRHYEDEDEIRALYVDGDDERIGFDVQGGLIRRFVEGPILSDCLQSGSSITIGPAVRDPHVVSAYLIRCLKEARCRNTAIAISRAPYRS